MVKVVKVVVGTCTGVGRRCGDCYQVIILFYDEWMGKKIFTMDGYVCGCVCVGVCVWAEGGVCVRVCVGGG